MVRFLRPWSKKRGKRFIGTELRSLLWETAFYSGVFLVGVFVLSLVLISELSSWENLSSLNELTKVQREIVTPREIEGGGLGRMDFWCFGSRRDRNRCRRIALSARPCRHQQRTAICARHASLVDRNHRSGDQ